MVSPITTKMKTTMTTTMMITKTRLTNRKDYNEVNYANNDNEENNDEIVMTTINMRMMSRMKTMILKKNKKLMFGLMLVNLNIVF
jgi:hypothetical protein